MGERLFRTILILCCGVIGFQLYAGENLLVRQDTPLLAGPENYYRAIDTLKSQTIVELVEKKEGWFLVRLSNGKAGWLRSEQVKALDSVSTKQGQAQVVHPNQQLPPATAELNVQRDGNLRERPDTEAKILGKLTVGQTVKKLHQDGNWVYVQVSEGVQGWAHTILFQPKATVIAPNQVQLIKNGNLRASAALSGRIIGLVPAGTIITPLDSSGEWYRIQYRDSVGWLHKSLTTRSTNPGSQSAK